MEANAGLSWKLSPPLTGLGKTTGVPVAAGMAVAVRVALEVAVKTAVQVDVGVAEAVGVKVGLDEGVRLAVEVGVDVAWATVTVAPETGRPLNCAAWPLAPTAPVRLKS